MLRPGMYGRGSVVVAVHPNAMVIPPGALQISNDHRYVFTITGDQVKRVPVDVGVDNGDWLEVLHGLSPDAEIVTAGTDTLSDNAKVRVKRDVDPYTGLSASERRVPARD
jgi:membrane fusion protein (multidrug efflux system)